MTRSRALGDRSRDWRKRSFGEKAEGKPGYETSSHVPLEPLYTPADVAGFRYLEDLGFPGEFPFTRGAYPTMYRGRPWTIRQYAGFGTARQTNERFHYLLDKGQHGLSVAFDLPTQVGLDSDDPMAEGEVGRVGVAVDSLQDMRVLFDGIPLDKISTSMTINASAAVLLALYVALADERGVDRRRLAGTVQNDILKEYFARGAYIFPPGPSVRLVTDMFAWCAENVPDWNPVSVSGYHIREAGSTAVQEVAFTLADAIVYVEAGIRAGLDVDAFAPRLSFFFSAHNDFIEEVAKFRAARRMWARIMKSRFGAKRGESMRLRFHAQTAGSTLAARQPENNVVRVGLQALAAVLGGTQSLHTCSMDEALGLPSREAARVAVRTQQILLEESGVAGTIDPLGGSYAVEALTDEIESRANKIIEHVEGMGGMIAAVEQGYPQREIEQASYEFQKALERGERKFIGVNSFLEGGPAEIEPFAVDPAIERDQVAELRKRKAGRAGRAVEKALGALEQEAAGDGNLFPPILEAVKASATVGEICTTLARRFGRYKEPAARR